MKGNIPAPMAPEKIERVEIKSVELVYGLYSPHTLKPQYYIHFRIVLKNGEDENYSLTVAGIEKT